MVQSSNRADLDARQELTLRNVPEFSHPGSLQRMSKAKMNNFITERIKWVSAFETDEDKALNGVMQLCCHSGHSAGSQVGESKVFVDICFKILKTVHPDTSLFQCTLGAVTSLLCSPAWLSFPDFIPKLRERILFCAQTGVCIHEAGLAGKNIAIVSASRNAMHMGPALECVDAFVARALAHEDSLAAEMAVEIMHSAIDCSFAGNQKYRMAFIFPEL